MADRERPIDIVVAEYSALRSEILQAQQARMVVLGLVVTVVSAITSLLFTKSDAVGSAAPGLVAFGLLLVAIGVHFTAVLTQQMDRLGHYIRERIESQYDGGMWETYWTAHRESLRPEGQSTGLPLGQSKVYALIYGALITGLIVEYLVIEDELAGWGPVAVAVTVVAAAERSFDLYRRYSRHWGTLSTATQAASQS